MLKINIEALNFKAEKKSVKIIKNQCHQRSIFFCLPLIALMFADLIYFSL